MSIAHVHTDTTVDLASSVASQSVTKPTGIASTDLCVLAVATDTVSGTTDTITPGTGLTRIGAQVLKANGPSEQVTIDAFWFWGSVASPVYNNSLTGANQGYVCAAFSGCDSTTPIDVAGTGSSSSGAATLTINGITIVTAGAWMLVAGADWTGASVESITGFTASENAHSNAAAAILYNTTGKSAGATGNVTLNAGSGSTQIIVGQPFALRPAGAGGGSTLFRRNAFPRAGSRGVMNRIWTPDEAWRRAHLRRAA